MKIKHWQGYGSVIARKISEKKVTINEYGAPEKATQVVIHVQGNHEYGIERDDDYDVYNWLLKRFCKVIPEYNEMKYFQVSTNSYYKRNEKENIDEENCDYTITYA